MIAAALKSMAKREKVVVPDISRIPAEYRPSIGELPGDMNVLASGMEERFPGMGVLIVLAMVEITGGQWVYIRKMDGPVLNWRNNAIRAMYDQGGVTGRELARIWRLSQSSIEKILAKPAISQRKKVDAG